jgi:hypothetical protein
MRLPLKGLLLGSCASRLTSAALVRSPGVWSSGLGGSGAYGRQIGRETAWRQWQLQKGRLEDDPRVAETRNVNMCLDSEVGKTLNLVRESRRSLEKRFAEPLRVTWSTVVRRGRREA